MGVNQKRKSYVIFFFVNVRVHSTPCSLCIIICDKIIIYLVVKHGFQFLFCYNSFCFLTYSYFDGQFESINTIIQNIKVKTI